jgi:hypothetical protein
MCHDMKCGAVMEGSICRDGEGLDTRVLAVVMATVSVNLHCEQTGSVVVQLP